VTVTSDALASSVPKVSVSPALKARTSSDVIVSKVYAFTLRPMTAESGDNGPTLPARKI
jgi:hypothetical protein